MTLAVMRTHFAECLLHTSTPALADVQSRARNGVRSFDILHEGQLLKVVACTVYAIACALANAGHNSVNLKHASRQHALVNCCSAHLPVTTTEGILCPISLHYRLAGGSYAL
jgi:hypothetical protein